jgi:hypothetical protein
LRVSACVLEMPLEEVRRGCFSAPSCGLEMRKWMLGSSRGAALAGLWAPVVLVLVPMVVGEKGERRGGLGLVLRSAQRALRPVQASC